MTRRDLTWLVEQGFLRRPIKGVYVDPRVPETLDLRIACLRTVTPADAVICDRHAGWLLGAEMVLAPGEHLDVQPVSMYLPRGRRLRNDLADSGERMLRPEDVMDVGGLRVTTPLRTALDLGRTRWTDRALAAVDQMLRLDAFSKEQMLAEIGRFRGMRWVTVLRVVVPLADGRAESPPESVLRLRWIECHLPAPTPQLELWANGDFLARLDLGNPELEMGAEYDSDEWHSTPAQLGHDRSRRAAVERETDWVVVPVRRENLFGPAANVEHLLRAGAVEARRRGRRTA